jgi:hypothetical protein
MEYVIVYENYSNICAIIKRNWIFTKSYEKGSTVFSFFCKNINNEVDIKFERDNYSKNFDGLKKGIFKFVIHAFTGKYNSFELRFLIFL